ncbi:Monomeric sarcosine oxidase [Gimesia panareensis]|uniref:Monomeric sarcosine oxidase n=1 Tax=Gimesia panareensis TaxID=2527978 RepID=A0A518FNZ1_9PLAN|nr:N-methyl-L-tryptophan oxidase [Gimesia panareensis]QDV17985.1 Monomeric sarcosine oxidase [Gimesia panareensis]
MPVHVDYLVLGLGGMGSSALYHLARRGLKVLGVEQFGIAHDRGSSHGETRIIRKAYFEHPDYIPLLQRAYSLWEELEQESEKSLFNRCGLMVAGPPEGAVIKGVHLAEERHSVKVESLSAADVLQRCPGFQVPVGFEVTFEPEAGFLHVEECVQAHMDCALAHGAQIVLHEPVESLLVSETEIEVQTANQHWVADGVIVTAGAWSSDCLKELQLPLEVVRKVLFWNPVLSPIYDLEQGRGGFFFDMPYGEFYGFPSLDGKTVKLAEHTGGAQVPDPTNVDRELSEVDATSVARFVGDVMPGLNPSPERHAVCMYTRTPDGHFIIDQHPRNQRLVYGAGFSGHGFKFASVMGEILADLVTEGRTSHPIDFLRADRFQGEGA